MRTSCRAKSGAASTVMMPIGVPKVVQSHERAYCLMRRSHKPGLSINRFNSIALGSQCMYWQRLKGATVD